jgi:hypothetical protein
MTQELDSNYLEYTDPITDPETTEFYLRGPTWLTRGRSRACVSASPR